jgi:hypothetical protein
VPMNAQSGFEVVEQEIALLNTAGGGSPYWLCWEDHGLQRRMSLRDQYCMIKRWAPILRPQASKNPFGRYKALFNKARSHRIPSRDLTSNRSPDNLERRNLLTLQRLERLYSLERPQISSHIFSQ